MTRKRSLSEGTSLHAFLSERDRELFEVDRNILARIVYKNQYQFRRIDILNRVKHLVKSIDLFLKTGDMSLVPSILQLVDIASERFFQQLTMGLMVPLSITCVAAIARLGDTLRRTPSKLEALSGIQIDDEGEIIAR